VNLRGAWGLASVFLATAYDELRDAPSRPSLSMGLAGSMVAVGQAVGDGRKMFDTTAGLSAGRASALRLGGHVNGGFKNVFLHKI